MKLRRRELCSIHKSYFCCGRERSRLNHRFSVAVQRIEDRHHPRGYRELRSPAEMRRLLKRKIIEQDNRCAICGEVFTDIRDIVPDHRDPRGMGGGWRDDHPDNIRAAHRLCNQEKGSKRNSGVRNVSDNEKQSDEGQTSESLDGVGE